MRNLMIVALASALTACGSPSANDTDAAANDAAAVESNSTAPLPVEEAPPADEPTPSPAETPGPSPTPTAPPSPDETEEDDSADAGVATIPAALRGRWGLVPADCTSTRGDAKGLLRITRDTLRFYESRGTLGRVVEQDRSRIVADFDFTGEGQTWQRRIVLDGQDGGRTLIRRERGEGAMPGVLRYQRCAD